MKEDKEIVRRLGRTGLEVSVLGLGGHTYPVGKSSDSFQSYEDRARLVRHLVSAGVNYFDTTWVNEVELLADSFKRADIKEDTLVSLQYVDGISDPEWRQKLRYEVEVRLNIMSYTHAPLFIMGMGGKDVSYSEVVAACEAMAGLKEEGLIRNMGVSCHKISLFPLISRAIRELDLIDYVMIRFNWKFQQANEELFPVAKDHDVGIVVMKVFCWDCGPSQWNRRISVFEPICSKDRIGKSPSLTPAQRSLLWCIQNSPCDVAIAAMNTMWEANQNIQALQSINTRANTDDFKGFSDRLWDEQEIRLLASSAESKTIRDRAKNLLKSNGPAHVALAKSARNAFLGHLKGVLGLKPSKR